MADQSGRKVERVTARRASVDGPESSPSADRATASSGGLATMFGLHPYAATLAVTVDVLLFGGDLVTLGGAVPFGVGVAAVLAWVVYRAQRRWDGDDHDAALIKAVTLGLLTAIPVPIAVVVALPAGIIGAVRRVASK